MPIGSLARLARLAKAKKLGTPIESLGRNTIGGEGQSPGHRSRLAKLKEAGARHKSEYDRKVKEIAGKWDTGEAVDISENAQLRQLKMRERPDLDERQASDEVHRDLDRARRPADLVDRVEGLASTMGTKGGEPNFREVYLNGVNAIRAKQASGGKIPEAWWLKLRAARKQINPDEDLETAKRGMLKHINMKKGAVAGAAIGGGLLAGGEEAEAQSVGSLAEQFKAKKGGGEEESRFGLTKPLLPEVDIKSLAPYSGKFGDAADYLYSDILRGSSSPAMLGIGAASGGLLAGAARFAPIATRGITSALGWGSGAMGVKDVVDFAQTGDEKELIDAGLSFSGVGAARGFTRRTARKQAERLAAGQGSLKDRVEAGYELGVPELEDAINKSGFRDFKRKMWWTGVEQLDRLGEPGQKTKRLLQRQIHTRRQTQVHYREQAKSILADVPDKHMNIIADLVEGKEVRSPAKYVEVARKLRSFFDQMGVDAREAGVMSKRTIKGKPGSKDKPGWVPFVSRKNYFPHNFDFRKAGSFEERLVKQGVKRAQARKIVESFEDTVDPRIPEIYQRRVREAGFFKKDKEAVYDHVDRMSEQMSRARIFGHDALAKPDSQLNEMIESAGPFAHEVRDIVERQLGRTKNTWGPGAATAVQVFSGFQAVSKLSYHLLANMAGNNPTFLHNEASALKDGVKGLFSSAGWRTAREAGATSEIGDTMLSNLKSGRISKLLGINLAEDINRAFAANAGMSSAENLLKVLKSSPALRPERKRLRDLILTDDINTVISRGELTNEELKFAAGRMSELTQGLKEGLNLPNAWTGDVWKNLFTLFHSFALQGGKSIWQAVRANPERNVPLALALTQIVGAPLGVSKAAFVGLTWGLADTEESIGSAVEKNLELRRQWPDRYPIGEGIANLTGVDKRAVNEAIANTFNSWILGFGTELVSSALEGEQGGGVAGIFPNVETATQLGGSVGQAINPVDPNLEPLARFGLRSLPFVGQGLQKAWMPTDAQR